jgi:transcriptional regulator with XRE-family HTH domain
MLLGLKAARQGNGLTQQELADSTGFSQPYINALENGRAGRNVNPPYDTIATLAEVLKVSINFLRKGEE